MARHGTTRKMSCPNYAAALYDSTMLVAALHHVGLYRGWQWRNRRRLVPILGHDPILAEA